MEKACVLQMSLSKASQDAFREYGHLYYSAMKASPLYCICLREKKYTEVQHRSHFNRVFKKLNMKPVRKRRWLELISEEEALAVINPTRDDERDTKVILLSNAP